MTQLVGILNVTPDSFSDGAVLEPASICARARELIAHGAKILDVGAESTRPGAQTISSQQEWERLEPVWAQLVSICREAGVQLSLDSRNAATVRRALALGCDWVNDVTGFRDDAMLAAVRDTDCKLVVMHALSVPVVRTETLPADADMVRLMREWAAQQQQRLNAAGVSKDRLIFDAGLGFGKSYQQNWELLAHFTQYRGDMCWLVGHSRKSLFTILTDAPPAQRDAVTRVVSAMMALNGADYLRVHDVAGHATMLQHLEDGALERAGS
jgi:dihydropteroate synthase